MRKVVPTNAVIPPEDAREVYSGTLFSVYHWRQHMFDGRSRPFEMVRRADTVQTLAVVEGKILLLEDDQPHAGSRVTLPGGRVDDHDPSIEHAAERETRDETGLTFRHWRLVSVFQPVNKIEWFVYTFVAWDPGEKSALNLDGGEKMTPRPVDIPELKRLIDEEESLRFPEGRELLKSVHAVSELLELPEFVGKTIDR